MDWVGAAGAIIPGFKFARGLKTGFQSGSVSGLGRALGSEIIAPTLPEGAGTKALRIPTKAETSLAISRLHLNMKALAVDTRETLSLKNIKSFFEEARVSGKYSHGGTNDSLLKPGLNPFDINGLNSPGPISDSEWKDIQREYESLTVPDSYVKPTLSRYGTRAARNKTKTGYFASTTSRNSEAVHAVKLIGDRVAEGPGTIVVSQNIFSRSGNRQIRATLAHELGEYAVNGLSATDNSLWDEAEASAWAFHNVGNLSEIDKLTLARHVYAMATEIQLRRPLKGIAIIDDSVNRYGGNVAKVLIDYKDTILDYGLKLIPDWLEK